MNERQWLYKLTAWTVTLGLLLQLFPIWLGLDFSPVAAEGLAENGTTAVSSPTSPLSISRSQSSYASGDGLTVTYAIHNSLPPTQAPDVVAGQTLTDTLAALGAFDPLADPNSLRQVILVVEPTEAAFVNASLPASLDNGVYTFHLDDIPPLGKAIVTIELDGPGGVTEPTELDSGAAGWGMVNGRAYHAAAPPAILWPDSMGNWLNCTLDANCQDEYVIAQAAQLGQNPASLFAFVRDLPFESYSGSLRGARGALWSEAGNSVDQASLLIALLRASGVPARYRSGQLANPEVETLILSMFPAPLGVVGYLPDDNPFPLADPLQNPALWNEIRDHYWVEAYLPGLGWTDLDPSFAAAQIGDRFVNEPDPAALSELPADLRHSVALRVKVEKYHPLSGLTHSYPLDYSFSAVELVGEPVTFGHLVQTQNQGGLIFANIFHTYTPYLMLADADALLEGEPFQEIITNFPLGTSIVTGEWLEIELRQPDGTVELHEREIYDAIGYDGRFNGGTITIGDSGRTNQPIVSELTLFTALFAPSFVPVAAIDSEFAAAATAVTAGQSAYERVNEIMADGAVSPDETDDLIAAVQAISRMTSASQRVLLMQHAAADFGARRLEDAFLTRAYYDAPRVHLMAWETNTITGQQTVTLDLRRNKIRALPYPGQSLRGWQAFNVAYGLAAMNLESDLLQRFSPDAPVKSVANILSAAQEQNIPLVTISHANLQELNDLTISAEAKARITVDLVHNPNHFVIVPAAPVTLGDEETVGWLRGDILSGETIDVSEEGLHIAAVQYSILLNASIQEIGFALVGFGQGFAGFTFVFLGEFLAGIPGDMKMAWNAALAAATQWAEEMSELIAENMEHDWVEAFLNGAGLHGGGEVSGPGGLSFEFGEFDWRFGGFNNGAAMAASVIGSADPPLPPALAARLPEHQFYRPAVGVMAVTGSGGTAVNATLNLDSLNVQGTLTAAWENSAQSGLRFQQLNGQGELLVNGNSVGNGSVVAHNGYMETNGSIAYASAGTGGMGFYAPSVSGLGSGAFGGETAVTLTPNASAQLTLRGATAVLNGQVYSGTMSLITTNPVALQASGAAAAPHFANAASLSASGATLGLPPTAANITIGGTAVSLQNGLALPNFNGTIGVSEANAAQDQVTLNGNAHYFQLALDPPAATTPGATAAFQANITANFSDSYTVTLSAPGWAASVAPDGGLTVTPPLTAAPGDYTVVVTAQSFMYPTAVAVAEQVVTVQPIQGVDVTIQPDPIYTIPWGEPDGPEGATNNGQVQIPNAAYAVKIVNRSSQPHTFDLSVSGLNPDWLIFAGGEGQTTTQVTLPAGGTTWVGLYVRPDTPQLPAPGTSVPFAVTAVAQADPDVNDSDNATFVMAAVPFQRLWAAPATLFAMSGTTAEFDLYLRNLGNAPGGFALAPHLPEGWQLAGLQSPQMVNPGQTAGQLLTLDIPAATLGRVYRVNFASPVPGQVYTQWTTLNVRIVSPNTAPIFQAAVGCLADEAALAAALHALALAMAALEESCEDGCSLALRGQVVAAAEQAADYGRLMSHLGQTHVDLTAAAAHLSAQSGDAAILDALPLLTTAVTNMEQELCAILAYRPTLRLTPWMDAALPGQPITYDLQLTNRGTLTTSYAVTVTLPGETLIFEQTVSPGATEHTAVAAASPDLGLYLLQAEARALDAPIDYLIASAEARLNVVERFIQVTAVTADPPFVETGASETTLQVEIANVAGIGLSGVVETAVYAPNGTTLWSGVIPLNILGGAPRLYDLTEVNTSGWTAGVYTITADVQLQGAATNGGSGYGYLSVGQAVIPSHAVVPDLVAPGTVTVTTLITTEINQLSIVNGQSSTANESRRYTIYDAPYWNVQELAARPFINVEELEPSELSAAGPPPAPVAEMEMVEETAVIPTDETTPLTFTPADPPETAVDEIEETVANPMPVSQASLLTIGDAYFRVEQNDPAVSYTGTWSNFTHNRASGGSYWRNAVAGSTAELTFDGDWLNLGFIGTHFGGHVDIAINGGSQGLFDLYRREDNTPISLVFADLGAGPHTVSLTVVGSGNPFSSGTRVQLDYIDYWDGTPLGDGLFEETDARVLRGGGWTDVALANASGGGYGRGTAVTAWIPFDGDSFTYQAIAYSAGGKAQLFVDGSYLDTVDLYHPNSATNALTRTFSYEGFGSGPHILQINSYRGMTTLDAFSTPGVGPFIDPNPPVMGITRFEEDHPAIRYNGVPFAQTGQSWVRAGGITVDPASDGQVIYSAAGEDTISFDFVGSWIGVGFFTDRFSGQAEIAIDGDLVAEIDLYTRENGIESFYFAELGEGAHTITVHVLGTRHVNSSNNRIHLDYFDVWDGQPLAEGLFEETDERIYYSSSWSRVTNAGASGGGFASSSSGTAWFPFTGDSVTFSSWTAGGYHSLELKIDGVSQDYFNTYSHQSGPRAFSFAGLGAGPHVLEVRQYRGNVTVDTFITPSTGENYTPPAPSGVIRLEEDHPQLRYNGFPVSQMPQSWAIQSSLFEASGNYNANSTTAGATVSLEFEGPWVGAGFLGGGVVEIFIDGASRGTFDTAVPSARGNITSVYFDDLITGTHTISITRVSGSLRLDYIDIWDGQSLDDGWYNATLDDYSGRFHYSNKTYWGQYENQYAYEGDFVRQNLINANPNLWFTFVGRDLTLLSRNGNNALLAISIDGQYMGEFNLTATYSNQPHALHFPDLSDGPHVVQIHTRAFGIVDAFEVNPDGFYSYTPQVKWHDASPGDALGVPGFYDLGLASTIAIGDLNGDGLVELVIPSTNGRMYVYRGDGQDAGAGTPILWTTDAVGVAAEPALADLMGDGTAEIIACGFYGTFAFRHDGFQLWENDAVKCFWQDSGPRYFGWGGPTIGNLDDDPHPEIVIAARADALYVLDHQGNILASDPMPTGLPSVPVLADINGDGALNIIVAHAHSLKVYEYDPLDGLEIVWTYTLTQTTLRSGVFGSPAVADITGDGQPEIIINWGHRVEAIRADGSLLWSYYTGSDNHFRPSPITVADTTGDGQVNIVTASAVNAGFLIFEHLLMVLNSDGTLLWQQPMGDTTASASGVAAQDLTGNGVWEVMWSGSSDGFLILRGSDGKRLFNEPVTASGTIMEYPSLGDVDGDGVADVVLGGYNGIYVISHVGRWVNSRPIWNQHNYHVTNINDNWSVPLVQPDSWALHNTYRTQTPEQAPAPSYRIEITHTVGVSDVTVLSDTFSAPPAGTPPQYNWQYNLEWYAPVNTITFASELAAMQPGETRQINQGTEIGYRLPSGWNTLTLPPLYVTAARILDVAPVEQMVGVGNTAVYTLTLLNPGLSDDLYSLTVEGLPAGWLSYPTQVNVPAQSSVAVWLEVTTSANAELSEPPFLVTAVTGSGGQDMTTASLTLFNGLEIAIDPPDQTAQTGTAVTYTLTLTNGQLTMVNYQLSTSGLALVDLPDEIEIPGESAVSIPISVNSGSYGPQPFSVMAEGAGGSGTATAVLNAVGHYAVGLTLEPENNVAGPATPALFNLIATNLGDMADSYDLTFDLPPGWSAALDSNGTPVDSLSLPPHIFNSANLRLLLTPDLAAAPGDYDFSVTAVSQSGPGVQATITGTVEVLPIGVQVSIAPPQTSMSPLDDGLWQVTITNTGSVAGSFDLTAAGIISLTASFSPGSVTLAPGQVQTVQLNSGPLPFALPQTYPFWVLATLQSNPQIANYDEAAVTFTGYEEVELAWLPASQTVTNTLTANFLLIISNRGNIPTTYDLTLQTPGLTNLFNAPQMSLPAGTTAVVPVTVWAGASGVYGLTALIQSNQASASAAATLTIVGPPPPSPSFALYLPVVTKSGPPP